ncbi:cytochrome P450 [Amycolatopsis aidingensis]|uniref:cytochrome P450 n=1 Tax=Amycolatopsis aidingensis TaxID=2842453 RepID=UPI001E2E4123|nr:cytochrome P450 [Amycolatopsis aidingensis]
MRTHPGPVPAAPVAPGGLPLLGHTISLLHRPLRFVRGLREYGDVVTIHLGTLPAYMVTEPRLAGTVLAAKAEKFEKGIFFEKFRPYFGNGLALSSGDFYRRQRRLVQPALHRGRIARYTTIMAELAEAMTGSWEPGRVVAVDRCMQDLALAVIGRTLFSAELGRRAVTEIQRSVPVLLKEGIVRAFSPRLVERLPIPGNRRFDRAIARVRGVVQAMVREARADGTDRGDLLSMLLLARDEETGEGMSDQQVQDEVVTLLTAGTETSAIVLAWLFHELGRHREVERRFHAEVDAVLGGRVPGYADLRRLTYTGQVINEVLRVRAPWLIMRRTTREVELGGLRLPQGTEVALSPHALHHDPRNFADPDRFDPDRWTPERAASLPREAYLPFGEGLHRCPGRLFAHAELAVVAATVGARWRLVPVLGKRVRTKVLGMAYPDRLPMTPIPRH